MDIFSHALWTNLAYYPTHKHRLHARLWAVFFGVLPDLISFSPVVLYAFISGTSFPRQPAELQHPLFTYAVESYNYTHSFVIFLAVFVTVALFRKGKIWWPLLAWAFHIALDIFTHPDFFSTPFLFPLSNFKNYHGLSWTEPHFLAINWIVLIVIYSYLIYNARKRNAFKRLAFLNIK